MVKRKSCTNNDEDLKNNKKQDQNVSDLENDEKDLKNREVQDMEMKVNQTPVMKKTKKKKDILATAKGICNRYDDTMKDLAK